MSSRRHHGSRGNRPIDRNMGFPGPMFGGEPGYSDMHQPGPPQFMPQGGIIDTDPYTLQAQVIVIDPDRRCRDYAEMIHAKLKRFGLMCDIIILDKFTAVNQVIDEAVSRGLLYIVSVNVQNEMHQSATVNILQGQPQEHRNMPLEDAFKLVSRHFDAHLLKLANSKSSESVSITGPDDGTDIVDDIDPSLSLLLIGLAEGKSLKLAELDQVLDHLIDKREKITGVRGYRSNENRNVDQQINHPKPVQPPTSSYNKFGQRNEAYDLQAKITKLFGNSSKQQSTVGVKSSALTSGQQDQGKKAVGIDFTNPTVQNALNNLMKTGPKLLDDIKHTSAGTTLTQEQESSYKSSFRSGGHPDDQSYEDATPKKRAKPGRHAIAGFY